MGADGQPQIHLQAYVAMIDFGLDVQQAIEAPRWLSGRFALGEPRDLLNMEGRFPRGTLAELERRGHVINRWAAWNELAGHAHGITIDPATGARSAAPTREATARRSATELRTLSPWGRGSPRAETLASSGEARAEGGGRLAPATYQIYALKYGEREPGKASSSSARPRRSRSPPLLRVGHPGRPASDRGGHRLHRGRRQASRSCAPL